MTSNKKQLSRVILVTLLALGLAPTAPAIDIDPSKLFAESPTVIRQADLDQLSFPVIYNDDRATTKAMYARLLQERPTDKKLKSEIASHQEWMARLATSPIGLELSKKIFHLDEPIHAYFLVKNTSNSPQGLDMRLDLQLERQLINSCQLSLKWVSGEVIVNGKRRHFPGPPKLKSGLKEWQCGGPSHLALPAKGYYVTRSDLRRLGVTQPGVYTLSWRYAGLQSVESRFTVLPARQGARQEPTISAFAVAAIKTYPQNSGQDQQALPQADKVPVIRPAHLHVLPPYCFAAALSTSSDGRVYPDIFALPSKDQFIKATARFADAKKGKLPKALVVTLSPLQKNPGLSLHDARNITLLVSSRQVAPRREPRQAQQEFAEELPERAAWRLSDPQQPLQITIDLVDNWTAQLPFSGPATLQVIISSKPIQLQGRHSGLQSLHDTVYASKPNVWPGLLCTPAISINLPPLAKPRR